MSRFSVYKASAARKARRPIACGSFTSMKIAGSRNRRAGRDAAGSRDAAPAFFAAARACAMNGRVARRADAARRMRNSSAIASLRNVQKTQQVWRVEQSAHIAPKADKVRNAPENPSKTTDRATRNVRPFSLPSCGCWTCRPRWRPPCYARVRQGRNAHGVSHDEPLVLPSATNIGSDRGCGVCLRCSGTGEWDVFDGSSEARLSTLRRSFERGKKSGSSRQSGGDGGAAGVFGDGAMTPSAGAVNRHRRTSRQAAAGRLRGNRHSGLAPHCRPPAWPEWRRSSRTSRANKLRPRGCCRADRTDRGRGDTGRAGDPRYRA